MIVSEAPRYAIYAVPEPGSDLWAYGIGILGYDAAAARLVARLAALCQPACNWPAWTAGPRKYGFHATLKAPFFLSSGDTRTEATLLAAVANFALARSEISLGYLALRKYKSFVALLPEVQSGALTAFAADCVREFDAFRAPLTAGDIARRQRESLTARQQEHLANWGYPYVFEEFRYHMTLTGRLDPEALARAYSLLAGEYKRIDRPVVLDHIAVFRQQSQEEFFTIIGLWRLGRK